MTTNYHTPFDETTQYKPSDHNAPLSELDTQITANVASIALRVQPSDFVCVNNNIVCVYTSM